MRLKRERRTEKEIERRNVKNRTERERGSERERERERRTKQKRCKMGENGKSDEEKEVMVEWRTMLSLSSHGNRG